MRAGSFELSTQTNRMLQLSKKSRFQHSAQNLCQMFCGHQLLHDYEVLAKLESGTLELDALSSECEHNGNKIEPLQIAATLHQWLKRDLKDHNLRLSDIDIARLSVQFQTNRHAGQRTKNQTWAHPTPFFVSCKVECFATVEVGRRTYEAAYQDEIEWPENYPEWRP